MCASMIGPSIALTHADKNVAKDLGNCSMCSSSSWVQRLSSSHNRKYWMSKAPHLMIDASTSSFERRYMGMLNASLVSTVITPCACKQPWSKKMSEILSVNLLTTWTHHGFLVYNFLKDCTLSCTAETMAFYFCFIKKLVHQEHRVLCFLHTSSMRMFQAFSKSGPTKQQWWHSGLVWFSGLAGSWRLVKYANTIPPGAISTARLLRKLSKSSMLCWANSRAIVGSPPRIQERPLL